MIYRLSPDFKLPSEKVNSIRGNSNDITAADSFDLMNLPSDLTSNLLTVFKQSLLVVSVEQSTSGGTAVIIPILYGTDGPNPNSIICILNPRSFTQPYALRYGSSSGKYALPAQTWDILGAHKIGLFIASITGSNNGIKVYGALI